MNRLRHPIRAIREPFGTAGLIIAMIALVAALGGTALAAKGALTGKQKKEVEKIAKKYAGKDGAAGANGTNGVNGKDGANGTNGGSGPNGKSVTVTAVACGGLGGAEVKQEGAGSGVEVCNGEEGEEGQDAGFNYLFSAGTAATDPGSGKVALNEAAPGSATTLSISETDADSNGLESVLATWFNSPSTQGNLLIRKAGVPSTFAEYKINGSNKDEGAFHNIVVVSVANHGTFADGDPITIAYWSGGTETLPKGATETGYWSFSGGIQQIKTEYEEAGVPKFEEVTVGRTEDIAPIFLTTRLAANFGGTQGAATAKWHYQDEANFSDFDGAGPETIGCTGFPAEPTAPPNNICVYKSNTSNVTYLEMRQSGGGSKGIGKYGGFLKFSVTGPSAVAEGTWAVTAG